MTSLKRHIKGLFPQRFWNSMHNTRAYAALLPYRIGQKKAEKRTHRKHEPINVLFFALYESIWKYDSLFQLMLEDSNYNPIVFVCPVNNKGEEYMVQNMKRCAEYFMSKGYPCVCGYEAQTHKFIDPHQFNPDIIFFTRPYHSEVPILFARENYKDVLTCYVNYLYVSNNEPWSCADYFHKSLWRYYLEYPTLLEQINDFCAPYRINGKVVGYPLFDAFRQHKVTEKDWPISGKRRKRIIWAPHYSITGNTGINAFSTFEQYYDFMPALAEKYKNEIEIVFKPHPLLKACLYEADEWGQERTDAYYEMWDEEENMAYVDGEYVGLFLASDAMIHDCNSFTVEYLAVNKPAMFLDSGKTDDKMNSVAKEARACHYKGYAEKDIERFISDVVINSKDDYREKRENFCNRYILPENGKLAAENIMDDLNIALGRKC